MNIDSPIRISLEQDGDYADVEVTVVDGEGRVLHADKRFEAGA